MWLKNMKEQSSALDKSRDTEFMLEKNTNKTWIEYELED